MDEALIEIYTWLTDHGFLVAHIGPGDLITIRPIPIKRGYSQ